MLKSTGLKRATVVRVPTPIDISALVSAMNKLRFKECGKSQEESWGFIPPDDLGYWPLLASIRNYHLITLRHDRRVIHKSRLSREWHSLIRRKEASEQRKLNKDERDALRCEVKADLFPSNAPSEHTFQGIYDGNRRLLVVLEKSAHAVDFFLQKLNRALEDQGMEIEFKASETPPVLEETLTAWAYDPHELPKQYGFEVGTALRLENNLCKAVLSNQESDSPEVKEHLHQKKTVTQIELIWCQQVEFVLSNNRVLSQMNFKKYCADSMRAVKGEASDDIRAYLEASFIVYLEAFYELWDAISVIPPEI